MPGRAIPNRRSGCRRSCARWRRRRYRALVRREAPEATLEQVQRVHPERYTSRILGAVPETGYVRVDADTVLNPHSGEAALRAAGRRLRRGRRGDGGRGGQGVLRHAPARAPCRGHGGHGLLRVQQRRRGACRPAPCTSCRGSPSSISTSITATAPRPASTTIPTRSTSRPTSRRSIPAPASPRSAASRATSSTGRCRPAPAAQAWRRVVERDILPAIDAWRPQLIFVSAGFDAHAEDPLASMALVEDDFAWVTRELCRTRRPALRRPHCLGPGGRL